MPLIKEAPRFLITVNGVDQPDGRVISVRQGVNGDNEAVIEFEGTIRQLPHIQNQEVRDLNANQIVKIEVQPGAGVIHLGRIVQTRSQLGPGERVRYVSRTSSNMFGSALAQRTLVWGGVTSDRRPVVFNTKYEGQSIGNMSDADRHGAGVDFRVFYDPQGEYLYQVLPELDGSPQAEAEWDWWTIPHAVVYLCKTLNPQQQYFKNPVSHLEVEQITGSSKNVLRGHSIRYGSYLPEALTDLLMPYGYMWFIDYQHGAGPKIRIAERSGNAQVQLDLQDVGEDLDIEKTTVRGFDLSYDIDEGTYDEVEVIGGRLHREMTIELVPGWDADLDDTPADQLKPGSPEMVANPKLERVWRDWVYNETGEYFRSKNAFVRKPDGTTTTEATTQDYGTFGFAGGGQFNVRRRRLKPTLSVDSEGRPAGNSNGVHVEVWDGTKWLEPSSLPGTPRPQVLTNECGIRLYGGRPHPSYMAIGFDVIRVRVTATIELDATVLASDQAAFAHTVDRKTKIYDMESAFTISEVDSDSVLKLAGFDNVARDDTDRAEEFAVEQLAQLNQATLTGSIQMNGIDFAVQYLGNSISRLDGRNIGLATSPRNQVIKTYPAVTAVEWDLAAQQMNLTLSTFTGARR